MRTSTIPLYGIELFIVPLELDFGMPNVGMKDNIIVNNGGILVLAMTKYIASLMNTYVNIYILFTTFMTIRETMKTIIKVSRGLANIFIIVINNYTF